MFSRAHFALTLNQLLSTQGRVVEHYESLLQEIENPDLRLEIVALRQEVHRRVRIIHALLGCLGK